MIIGLLSIGLQFRGPSYYQLNRSTSSIYSESAYFTDFSSEHNITPIWPSVSVTLCGVFSAIIIKLHNCTGAHKFVVRAGNPYPDKLDAIYYSVRKKLTDLIDNNSAL